MSTFTSFTQHSTRNSRYSNQTRRIKDTQIKKEAVKLSLFADNVILYVENPEFPTKKLLELINEFSNIAAYKINIQKLVVFIYINKKLSERQNEKTISFTIASKNKIKYLGINLTKEVKDLYLENFKTLKKETGEDTDIWKPIPCSWTGRTDIIKMSILHKGI